MLKITKNPCIAQFKIESAFILHRDIRLLFYFQGSQMSLCKLKVLPIFANFEVSNAGILGYFKHSILLINIEHFQKKKPGWDVFSFLPYSEN